MLLPSCLKKSEVTYFFQFFGSEFHLNFFPGNVALVTCIVARSCFVVVFGRCSKTFVLLAVATGWTDPHCASCVAGQH